jgi:hypothetical protein
LERLKGPFASQDLLETGLEVLRGRTVADEPIDLRPVAAQDEGRRRPRDGELLERRRTEGFVDVRKEEDEIFFEEGMELGVLVKLLTQQSAAPSATAEEIDEDELVLAPGLGHGLVQRTLEPVLGKCGGCEDENGEKKDGFLHETPPTANITSAPRVVNAWRA